MIDDDNIIRCSICLMKHHDRAACKFTEGLNLTPKRIQTLELVAGIRDPKGCYVSHIADVVLTSDYRKEKRHGFAAQQSTRSGAGYAIPLIKAGLLRKHRTTYGWGTVTITDAGRKVLADHKAANDPANMPLDAVIARAVEPLRCMTCKVELDQPDKPETGDCGGDCVRCMADAGDPQHIDDMRLIEPGNPKWSA